MSLQPQYNVLFQTMYEYFNNNIYDASFFPFNNIYYTDEMEKDVLMFCTPKPSENLSQMAVTILPNDVLDEPIILIDITTNNKLDFAKSLFHELIHIYDYKQFSDYYLHGSYEDMNNHPLLESYRMWSEFRAHPMGDMYTYKYVDSCLSSQEFEGVMDVLEENLRQYILNKRLLIDDNQPLYEYDLSKILGYINFLDKYNDIHEISDSYIYEYLPLLLHSKKIDLVYDLYELYFLAEEYNDIFLKMDQIHDLRVHVFHASE